LRPKATPRNERSAALLSISLHPIIDETSLRSFLVESSVEHERAQNAKAAGA
jgi:hypothetical protein